MVAARGLLANDSSNTAESETVVVCCGLCVFVSKGISAAAPQHGRDMVTVCKRANTTSDGFLRFISSSNTFPQAFG